MEGMKIGFKFVDLAKSWGTGVGSVRLKDGSSVKILGKDNAVDFFCIKRGKLLESKGYRGENAVSEAACDMCHIEEQLAESPKEAMNAWTSAFDVII